MIVWQRWGILVVVVVGLSVGLGFLLEAAFIGGTTDNTTNGVFVGLGWVVGGAGIYFLSKYVIDRHLDKPYMRESWANLPQPETTPTGEVITRRLVSFEVRPRSSLFFIPVRWWAYIVSAAGLVIFAANLVTVLGR